MLLNLEKLLVKREDLGWTSGTRAREERRRVRQNLFQMPGGLHREFGLLFNLKSDLQNPNPSKTRLQGWTSDTLPSSRQQDLSPAEGLEFQE
jgi:hypothetical protein